MEIFQVPEDRRYWVVRAESGRYYEHFIKYGLIALGHLNCIHQNNTPEGEKYFPDENELKASFKRYHDSQEHSKQSTTAKITQIKSFIYDMSIGDWVVTVGNSFIRFGRIIGDSYIDNNVLTVAYDHDEDRKLDMDFTLRRTVSWGPYISKKELPYGLSQSLKSNLTVFSLDRHWEAVHHSLYPAFMKGERLYLSSKIRSSNDIKNYSMSSLLALLNEIEVIAKEIANNNVIANFEECYSKYINEDILTITTKAQFHSAGDIWNVILTNGGKESAIAALAFSMIFGNNVLGFDGIIDLDTRHVIRDIVIERMEKNNTEKMVRSLELKVPSVDTKKLESEALDKN